MYPNYIGTECSMFNSLSQKRNILGDGLDFGSCSVASCTLGVKMCLPLEHWVCTNLTYGFAEGVSILQIVAFPKVWWQHAARCNSRMGFIFISTFSKGRSIHKLAQFEFGKGKPQGKTL